MHSTDDPLTALAAVILFDQFPRNMFRGDAEQFATDHIALGIAKEAVGKGFAEELPTAGAPLPLHAVPAQREGSTTRTARCCSSPNSATSISSAMPSTTARIIERFGRFPHRNAILGRASRPDEIAAGDVLPW